MRIKHLKLFTNNLDEQKLFYESILNYNVINEDEKSFTVKVGSSKLSFVKGEGKYNYHFASNIPSNKIVEALEWTKKRVEIQSFNDNEIVKFPNWDAKSIYFYDRDMNILEFISRKNLNANSEKKFNQNSLISLGEIGVPTISVAELYTKITNKFGLKKYDCEEEVFCAVGDEHGLFIVINYSKKKWLPNMDEAISSPFEIEFENSAGEKFKKLFCNDEFQDI